MPQFATEEYKRRLDRTKDAMAQRGLDVLLVTDPANLLYLTGYDAWSFYVPQMVMVFPSREEPLWVGREMDANAAELTTWLTDDSIRSYADEYIRTVNDRHPMDRMAEFVTEAGLGDGTLGVEMGAYYFTARDYLRLESNLPGATFEDATDLVNEGRLRKSEREVELIKEAAVITDNMMEAAVDAIEPGVRQSDVVADVYYEMISGTDEYGGDYSANPPMMPAGRGTNTPHLTWSDDRIESGQPMMLELGGCRHRYHAPLARTVYVGDPPSAFQNLHDVTVEALNTALDAIEPGVKAEEVELAYRDTIAEHGLEKESRVGYRAGGGEYPPSWGEGNWERIPSLQPGDTTVLEPGMTFHVIAGMWESEYGVEVSETTLVTDEGSVTMSDFPRELVVV